MTDVIVTMAEVDEGATASHRPPVRAAAQRAYEALLLPTADDPVASLPASWRALIAARAAWVDGDAAAADFYLATADIAGAADLVQHGADGESGASSSRRLRAGLRQVDLLVTRPAAATSDDLAGLTAAGWTPAEIVVLNQIVGLVSYQIRIAHALRVGDIESGH